MSSSPSHTYVYKSLLQTGLILNGIIPIICDLWDLLILLVCHYFELLRKFCPFQKLDTALKIVFLWPKRSCPVVVVDSSKQLWPFAAQSTYWLKESFAIWVHFKIFRFNFIRFTHSKCVIRLVLRNFASLQVYVLFGSNF